MASSLRKRPLLIEFTNLSQPMPTGPISIIARRYNAIQANFQGELLV
jgi:hypothetical protein